MGGEWLSIRVCHGRRDGLVVECAKVGGMA